MEQLTAQDASFIYGENTRSPMHIGGVAIYDPSTVKGGKQRFKDILQFIEDRLHLAKTFRRKLVEVPFNLDHPYWIEDKDFDLEYHVRHIRLPEPGDWRQFCIQVARLHSRPLDMTKAPWEITVIEGLDAIEGLPIGSYAMVTKIHHACIDGVAGADITEVLHSLEPYGASPPAAEKPWRGEDVPNPVELMTRAQFNNFTQPLRFAEVMARAVPAMATFQAGLAQRKFTVNTNVPKTRFGRVISSHRVVEGRTLDLAAVKGVRGAVEGATINDAVLAICGGALRKYLLSKKELPNFSLIAMAPISVRSGGESGQEGNSVAAMTVALGTDIEDPLERLKSVHVAAQASKEMTHAVGAKLMTDLGQFVPSTTAALASRLYSEVSMAEQITHPYNCVVSNVPGPQFPLYSAGARLVTQYGLGPLHDGMGLMFPVFSYCGKITIAVNACRNMIPDPEFFAECLQLSIDEMLTARAEQAG
jgi:diacylglycerol O-acyltransferase